MKRLRNDNKKLGLENLTIRELKNSDIERAGGGLREIVPVSESELELPISIPISGPPAGGFGEELNC
jgi:hypothetical protein